MNININLTQHELETIIEWYHITDAFFEERGIEMDIEEEQLIKMLKKTLISTNSDK